MTSTARLRPLVAAFAALALVLVIAPHLAWAGDDPANDFEKTKAQGWLWAYAGAFGAGILTSLTPCVYPMIPIVLGIFGGRGKDVSRGRAVFLATLYVLGMGLTFAVLGTVFALIGGKAGTLLANPFVIIPIVLLYAALAVSMFGAFELQLPAGLQQKLSGVSGEGAGGAFAMGLVGGFTAAPCTGPFLIGLLAFVTKTQSVALGSSLLFTYALGMGILFWVLAAFAIALPKSGPWMDWMKSFGGVALIVAGIHFLLPIAPGIERLVIGSWWFLAVAIAITLVGLVMGAIHLSFHDPSKLVRVRKAAAVAVTVVGVTLGINWIMHVDRELPWVRGGEAAAFAQAKREGKGVMIDFWASWCHPCNQLEHTFAKSPVYETIVDNFVPVKMDMSDPSAADEATQARYDAGTPTVVFVTADGQVIGRIREYQPAGKFMKTLGPAAEAIKHGRQTATNP